MEAGFSQIQSHFTLANIYNGIHAVMMYSGQLKEQLDVAIKEKHKLSQIIHKHETNFHKQHGR